MSNWALAGGLGRMAAGLAWQTPTGKGAMAGASLGAAYGMFSNNGSVLGSGLRGAGAGALIGSGRGGARTSAALGAGINTLMGGSPMWGALAGRGAHRYGGGAMGAMTGMRMGGFGWGASLRRGGQVAYRRARADARAAAGYIGRTARKVVNPIIGIPK